MWDYGKINKGIKALFWTTVCISILPFILHQTGVDFSSSQKESLYNVVYVMDEEEVLDSHYHTLSGAFIHTLLESAAFVVAFLTAAFSFTHFAVTRSSVTPIIGMALFMAGCMDAFHTLAADRLIEATAPNTDLIPFTWAICRAFNSAIMILGVCIVMFHPASMKRGAGIGLVLITSVIFGMAAWVIIYYCATEAELPQTMFPDSKITRPWDLISLILFLVAGALIFPMFHKRNPSLFSAAIWISVIPQIATQSHMAFGSTELFDQHFNIAHFLKIVAYLIPCTGLLLDYVRTHKHEFILRKAEELAKIKAELLNKELSFAHAETLTAAKELEHSNRELEQFAYVASHDLKAPLRGINNLAKGIEKDLKGVLQGETKDNMTLLRKGVVQLSSLLDDLLAYSKVGQQTGDVTVVNSQEIIRDIIRLTDQKCREINVNIHSDLPVFRTRKSALEMVLRNLITNAIQHHDLNIIHIEVSAIRINGCYRFSVKDDGPGIASKHHKDIFEMFKGISATKGSGMGLAIVKKLVSYQKGEILVQSQEGERGTTFIFDWRTET